MFYQLSRLYLSIDARIKAWLEARNGQYLLIGLSLGYTSAGLLSVWQAWHTRSVLGCVLGIFYSLIGTAFTTFLSARVLVEINIDRYASMEILRQMDYDKDRLLTDEMRKDYRD
jgi:hypothetical protein